jgi:hypothetical protein
MRDESFAETIKAVSWSLIADLQNAFKLIEKLQRSQKRAFGKTLKRETIRD